MTSSEPLVSVVTPFYNTDAYLAQCVESVLGQTYRNFEYILVDNQSTDRSRHIATEYARKDPRIRLVTTDRLLPQVQNYNFALEQMSPQARYCKMVQADDWIFPACLTEMVALAEKNVSIGLVSSYDLRETVIFGLGLHPSRTVLSGREAARMYLVDGVHLFGSPTTVMYRADAVRSQRPFFADGRLHEDTEAALGLLTKYDFGFVHQVLSFMRMQLNSITGKARDVMPESLDRLINVKRFGPYFMTPHEYDRCLEQVLDDYYRVLAHHWLRQRVGGRDQYFWKHHMEGLDTIGETIRWDRMATTLCSSAFEYAVNPGHLMSAVWRYARKRRRSNGTAG